MAYIYQADIYCDACGQDICNRLDAEGKKPKSQRYESDNYPKSCGDEEESDSPQHCGSGEDCLDPTILPSGFVAGHFMENDLTDVGVQYVIDAHKENPNEVTQLWVDYYSGMYDMRELNKDETEPEVAETSGSCVHCGGRMRIDETGVSNHVDEHGEIDYDMDANHVADLDNNYGESP